MSDEQIAQPPSQPTPVVQSWDVITSDPPPAAPAAEVPVVPAPAVATTAPAETPTLETETPLPADEPVRESESQIEEKAPKKEAAPEKDEDVEEGDTPEILAAPSGSATRRFSRQQAKMARPIYDFLDLDKPIKAFGDDLYTRSESRYFEHVDDIAKHHADYLTEKLFGVKSYAEVKAKLTANGEPAPTTTPQTPSTVAPLTAQELDSLTNEQIVQRYNEAQQTAAQQAKVEMETAMTAKVAALQEQLDAVTQKTTTHEQQARDAQVNQIGDELRTNVLKVVDEVIHDSGLEVKPDDPPKIANLKRAAIGMIKREHGPTFDAEEDNLKVIARVAEFARRLEKQNAFREEDNLKVRLRAACEKIKQTPEFQAIFDEIEAYAKPKATPRTGGPVVPAPGAPAGITPKSPMNWDETIQQAQAASS